MEVFYMFQHSDEEAVKLLAGDYNLRAKLVGPAEESPGWWLYKISGTARHRPITLQRKTWPVALGDFRGFEELYIEQFAPRCRRCRAALPAVPPVREICTNCKRNLEF